MRDLSEVRGQRWMASWHRSSANSNNHFCASECGEWPRDSLGIEEVENSSRNKSGTTDCSDVLHRLQTAAGASLLLRDFNRLFDYWLWMTNIVSAQRLRWILLLHFCIFFTATVVKVSLQSPGSTSARQTSGCGWTGNCVNTKLEGEIKTAFRILSFSHRSKLHLWSVKNWQLRWVKNWNQIIFFVVCFQPILSFMWPTIKVDEKRCYIN